MTATLERLREEAPDLSLSARSSASVPEQPPVRRHLEDLKISVLLEGRLPGGRILEQTFLLHDLVEHRGEPALTVAAQTGDAAAFSCATSTPLLIQAPAEPTTTPKPGSAA